MSGTGTALTEDVRLGGLGYGQQGAPPPDVLSNLTNRNQALSSVVEASAYASGELRLSYTTGSLPVNVSLSSSDVFGNVTGGLPAQGGAIFYVNNEWTDGGSDGSPVGFSMSAHTAVSIPVWILLPEVRSNAKPTLSQSELDTVTWRLIPSIDQIGTGGRITVAGLQAADCGGNHELLPFAHLPFTHHGNPYSTVRDDTVTCKDGAGAFAGS